MTPLPTDLAPPPVLTRSHRLRGLQRVQTSLGTKDTPPVEPPMPLCSRLRATHIAGATYKGLRGFERWVR